MAFPASACRAECQPENVQRDASVPREEATVLESFLEEHGGWKPFCGRRLMSGGR